MAAMIRTPGMLMIGAAGRNAGKTEFACRVIRRFGAQTPITGLKVTTVKERDGTCPRGGKGCGVCSSLEGNYCLTEERGENPAKDTARLLAAGAGRVFWLRVMREHLAEGFAAAGEAIGPDAVVVCESNSLRHVAEPDIFVIVREAACDAYKQSAADVRAFSDREVLSDGEGFDLDLADLAVVDGRWALRENATAVILAGGGSRRMGEDKSMLPVGGRPMIEHVYRQLLPNFREVLISCGDAGKYAFLGARTVVDETPGEGPLMGILSALSAAENDLCAVVACDIPEVRLTLLRRMLRAARGRDAVVPRSREGRNEPLFAVYRKSVLPAAREAIAAGKRKVDAVYEKCEIRFLELDAGASLHNINTRKDYDAFTRERGDSV
jgi:molybdopterin-guanine dinucleotide biosynthesis protein A